MTSATASKVARNCTSAEVQNWGGGVIRFTAAAQSAVAASANAACLSCPFRNNSAMGGCIGDECPVNAVRNLLRLAPKRVSSGLKEIHRAKCAARVA